MLLLPHSVKQVCRPLLAGTFLFFAYFGKYKYNALMKLVEVALSLDTKLSLEAKAVLGSCSETFPDFSLLFFTLGNVKAWCCYSPDIAI